jgi:uncharacterized protein (TIGR02466 family)
MSVEVHVENIFPTPIYITNIDVTDLYVDDIKCRHDDHDENKFVWISENEQLLETESRFHKIKNEIDEHMLHFYGNVLGYQEDVYPVMTTSWLVKSFPGHVAEKHLHANSIFSGVLYLKVPENSGNITFSRSHNFIPYLTPPKKFHSIYNGNSQTFRAKEGLLILFPSTLEHQVEKNLSESERFSISFNYFLKGHFKAPSSELILR